MLAQPPHQQLKLVEGHVLTATNVHKDCLGVVKKTSPVKQRAHQGILESLLGTILSVRDSRAKQATGLRRAEGSHEIIKTNVDQARPHHNAGNRPDTLGNHAVGRRKRFVHALLGQNQLSHSRVVKGDQGVGEHRQLVEGDLCLLPATPSLKIKWRRGKDHCEGSFLPGETSHQRGSPGACSSTEPHTDEDDLAIAQGIPDFQLRLFGCLLSKGGIAPRAQAFCEITADLDFLRGNRTCQSPHIRIAGKQFGTLHAIERNPVQHVGPGTSYPDDFDGGIRNGLLASSLVGNHGGTATP